METISNVASTVTTTVSKTIWGDQNTTQGNETAGQEPISGAQGKGTVNEPYDQGNDARVDTPTTSSFNDTSATSTTKSATMSSMPHNVDNAGQGGVPNPHHETEKTGVVGNMSQSTKGADINPSESSNPGLDPSSGIAPSQKQQGADRPKDAPTGDEAAAVKGKKDEAEEALAKRDPNDHSGEPMHMHDGSVPATQAERRVSKVGNPGGQEHGKEEKGTGEKWVKSTGLASEGGDFDVTKPGAGREADRLLEERGIKETSSGEHSQSDTNEPQETGHQEKQKVPLREKVKSKLHIGHK